MKEYKHLMVPKTEKRPKNLKKLQKYLCWRSEKCTHRCVECIFDVDNFSYFKEYIKEKKDELS